MSLIINLALGRSGVCILLSPMLFIVLFISQKGKPLNGIGMSFFWKNRKKSGRE